MNTNSKYIFLQNHFPYLVGILMVILYYIPFFVFGEDAYINILDCLDNDVAHFRMIVEQHALFNRDAILPLMYGIPRADYIVRLSPLWLFHFTLPPFAAYIANDMMVRLLGFIGMYLLLTAHCLNQSNVNRWIAVIVSVFFAYIPFYTIYGISSAGIPLALYAFMNLRNERNLVLSYCIVALFAIYSHLELIGVFIGLVLGIYYLVLVIRDKRWYIHLFGGLVLLGLGYAITNVDMIYSLIGASHIVSHREEFYSVVSNHDVLESMKELFQIGVFHSGTLYTKYIVGIIALGLLAQFWHFEWNKKLLVAVSAVLGTFLICVVAKFLRAHADITLLKSFQFDRFYFFLPTLWMVTLALALDEIRRKSHWLVAVLLPLVMIPSLYNANPELKSGLRQLQGRPLTSLSYRQYYDASLFDEIADSLHISDRAACKVVSIGMTPAVAEYNGFYTLDAYLDIYSLDYKHQFRTIIASELEKSPELKSYFDNWGNRCYLFTAEIGREYGIGKTTDKVIHNLELNTTALASLGCDYILSAVPIENYEQNTLAFIKAYETPISFRRIWVYKPIQ